MIDIIGSDFFDRDPLVGAQIELLDPSPSRTHQSTIGPNLKADIERPHHSNETTTDTNDQCQHKKKVGPSVGTDNGKRNQQQHTKGRASSQHHSRNHAQNRAESILTPEDFGIGTLTARLANRGSQGLGILACPSRAAHLSLATLLDPQIDLHAASFAQLEKVVEPGTSFAAASSEQPNA